MATQQRDMTTHVKAIAVLLIIFGGLGILTGLAMSGFGAYLLDVDPADNPLADDPDTEDVPPEAIGGILLVIGLLVLGLAIFEVITGAKMLKYAPWTRTAGIVFAGLSLFSIPFGTAFGVYAIWALLQDETRWLFEARRGPGQATASGATPAGWEPVDER